MAVAYLADWLGIAPAEVMYAVDDQVAAGDMFAAWPPLATPEMDAHYRAVMARPDLTGVAAEARDLAAAGVFTERESWGILYAISVSAIATATTAALAVGLALEHDLWPAGRSGAGPARRPRRRCASARPSLRPAGSPGSTSRSVTWRCSRANRC